MNFAVVFGASLWSGYALPACHPENGTPRRQPAELPLIKRENLSRRSRPALTAFNEAQAKGQIPPEEDFDPIFLWHSGKTPEEAHPHWIALKPRLHLKELREQGRIPVEHTCGFAFTDNDGNYHGIEWIDVDEGKVVFVESGMREQLFPLYLGDLFGELMTVLLYDRLMNFLASGEGSVHPSKVSDRLRELKQRFRFAGSHSGPTKVNFSLSLASGEWV